MNIIKHRKKAVFMWVQIKRHFPDIKSHCYKTGCEGSFYLWTLCPSRRERWRTLKKNQWNVWEANTHWILHFFTYRCRTIHTLAQTTERMCLISRMVTIHRLFTGSQTEREISPSITANLQKDHLFTEICNVWLVMNLEHYCKIYTFEE